MYYDAIVIGAGPAGTSAAYHLASKNRNVLILDKKQFPRDKSCGDGLTLSSVQLLEEMGISWTSFSRGQKVKGLEIHMEGKTARTFLYPQQEGGIDFGLVVPRKLLDMQLLERAIAQGADFCPEALVSDILYDEYGKLSGVKATREKKEVIYQSKIVIIATGSASKLAFKLRGDQLDKSEIGIAVRAYFTGISPLSDKLEIHLPILQEEHRHVLPSYGWIFPLGNGTANIGIGLYNRQENIDLRKAFSAFVNKLKRTDHRFKNIKQEGKILGAPMQFDFKASKCHLPGILFVGDAAGLVSPFTGEGIAYAIESGKYAAEIIHQKLSDKATNLNDFSEYATRLAAKYSGYFEAGRNSAQRYLFFWNVLKDTFESRKPIFEISRKSILFREGMEHARRRKDKYDSTLDLISIPVSSLKLDLLSMEEVLLRAVRQDWSFLTSFLRYDDCRYGRSLRPSLFFLLSSHYANNKDHQFKARVGAGIELGLISCAAHASIVKESKTLPTDKPNWGNKFAVMIGDYCMSKSYQLLAAFDAKLLMFFSQALSILAEAEVQYERNLKNNKFLPGDFLEILKKRAFILFSLPCKLGLIPDNNLTEKQEQALQEFSQNFGCAYLLKQEVENLKGTSDFISKLFSADIAEGHYNFSVLLAFQKGRDMEIELTNKIKRLADEPLSKKEMFFFLQHIGVIAEVEEVISQYHTAAMDQLSKLPEGQVKESFMKISNSYLDRKHQFVY